MSDQAEPPYTRLPEHIDAMSNAEIWSTMIRPDLEPHLAGVSKIGAWDLVTMYRVDLLAPRGELSEDPMERDNWQAGLDHHLVSHPDPARAVFLVVALHLDARLPEVVN